MADAIIKGSIGKGYELTKRHARLLWEAGKITKPTTELMKNYFVTNILVPELKKLKNKHVITDSPNEISGLRKYVGPITFNNEPAGLKQLNKLFQKIKENKPITQSTILDFTNPARDAAALGFSESSEQMANLWDAIEGLKEKRESAISKNSGPRSVTSANNKYENSMKELFRRNRRWLPKGTTFDKFNPDKYGWTEGSSRKGYLDWQKQVYKDSQAETRAIAQEHGITFDAGHGLSLGGLKLSPEEFKKLSIPIQQLIKADGQEDPDVEGGWHIRGTNSASNLAVEVAKYNRSKGSLSSRHIEDLLELNSSFTKTQSLAEYNLRNEEGFRKNTDYSRAVRNLLLHSEQDINAIQAKGENELLQTGIQEAPKTDVSQRSVTGELKNTTHTLGEGKAYTERIGNKTNISNILSVGPNPRVQQALSLVKDINAYENRWLNRAQNVAEIGLDQVTNQGYSTLKTGAGIVKDLSQGNVKDAAIKTGTKYVKDNLIKTDILPLNEQLKIGAGN